MPPAPRPCRRSTWSWSTCSAPASRWKSALPCHTTPRCTDMLVVVGDALLDRDLDGRAERLSPEAPVPVLEDLNQRARPGGAGLAAALAAADGREVVLITALADGEPGRELSRLLDP